MNSTYYPEDDISYFISVMNPLCGEFRKVGISDTATQPVVKWLKLSYWMLRKLVLSRCLGSGEAGSEMLHFTLTPAGNIAFPLGRCVSSVTLVTFFHF